MDNIKQLLEAIYGTEKGRIAFAEISKIIETFPVIKKGREGYFSEQDVILITYGDSLNKKGEVPLATLLQFAKQHLKGVLSAIHILPFYPFSSDDGFSVKDYHAVNPELGSWEDIQAMSGHFELMFDLVLNHISAQSSWFKDYLDGKADFKDLAIEIDPSMDLSRVVRPRALPLFTEVQKSSGEKANVWTTFSADQIDLNFESLDVLTKMIDVLLFYVKQGADLIRLDAIAYLWKESGSTCIHLQQTHNVVKLFHAILDHVAPDARIITETNVPHLENISYFGNGYDEAQMVYNFTLPPLLLYTFTKADSTVLSEWAEGLEIPSENNTFFNFTASHDGIGVRPLEGILPRSEIDALAENIRKNSGYVSDYKAPDGTNRPYELNATYIDALSGNGSGSDMYLAQRFLASQSIQYVLPGVPATYINSLLGSRNWEEGVKITGRARTINREKVQVEDVLSELKDPGSFRSRIFFPYLELMNTRTNQQAFHPKSSFQILKIDPRVFAIKRYCDDQCIYALTNISETEAVISLKDEDVPSTLEDLITGKKYKSEVIRLDPYQYVWLSS